MPNTIPANLMGQVVSNTVFQAFNDTLLPLTNFSIDFGGELTPGNKTVDVSVYSGKASEDFAGDYSVGSDSTIGNVRVVIDKHKFQTIHVTDTEVANSKAANIQNMAVQVGQRLALDVFQDILSEVLAANFARNVVKSAATFTSDTVVDIKDKCDEALMPHAGRSLMLADGHYNGLLRDDSIKSADRYGSTIGIQAGRVTNLVGFNTFQTSGIPANGEFLVGFAAVPSALAIAMRYLIPQAPQAYISTQRMEHPDTGIVIGVREWADPKTGHKYVTYEANYGYETGQADAGVRLVSQ